MRAIRFLHGPSIGAGRGLESFTIVIVVRNPGRPVYSLICKLEIESGGWRCYGRMSLIGLLMKMARKGTMTNGSV